MKALRQAGFTDGIEATTAQMQEVGQRREQLPRAARLGSRDCGFTVVELVVTIMIVGILAVAVVPRFFEIDAFRARGFYDETLAILRHAQKTAVAQRRSVYVRLDGSSETITVCYTNTFPCATTDQVPGPYGERPFTITAASGVDLQVTGTYFFDALGRPYNSVDTVPNSTFAALTISIAGGGDTRAITVEQETGYAR